jgi:hypothetical protein
MARRLVSPVPHLVLGASAFVCATMLACAGKSVRSGNEDGENAGEGGTRPSGGKGGNVAGGGVAGTSSGGTPTGGSSGSNTCPPCTPVMCTTTILPTQIINDFEKLYFSEDTEQPFGIYGILDESGMQKSEWWLGYFSGSYVYPMIPESCSGELVPAYPLVRNEREGVLRVTGTVAGPSGFGVFLGPCVIDMSAGYGIMFIIGGRAGSGALKMAIGTSSTTSPDACQLGRGKCALDNCVPPSVNLDITESPAAIALPWGAFSDGSPSPAVDPHEVVLVRWDFEWADGMNPYTVDVTLDNVMLIE